MKRVPAFLVCLLLGWTITLYITWISHVWIFPELAGKFPRLSGATLQKSGKKSNHKFLEIQVATPFLNSHQPSISEKLSQFHYTIGKKIDHMQKCSKKGTKEIPCFSVSLHPSCTTLAPHMKTSSATPDPWHDARSSPSHAPHSSATHHWRSKMGTPRAESLKIFKLTLEMTNCLVVDLPLWKIWKSIGMMIIPNIWKKLKCSKPPTR